MASRDQERLVAALDFAVEVHRDQKRKGTEIPYVSHLLQVAQVVHRGFHVGLRYAKVGTGGCRWSFGIEWEADQNH